jgi:hypothetical protein
MGEQVGICPGGDRRRSPFGSVTSRPPSRRTRPGSEGRDGRFRDPRRRNHTEGAEKFAAFHHRDPGLGGAWEIGIRSASKRCRRSVPQSVSATGAGPRHREAGKPQEALGAEHHVRIRRRSPPRPGRRSPHAVARSGAALLEGGTAEEDRNFCSAFADRAVFTTIDRLLRIVGRRRGGAESAAIFPESCCSSGSRTSGCTAVSLPWLAPSLQATRSS